jgi:PAS domain S-box-containing protein
MGRIGLNKASTGKDTDGRAPGSAGPKVASSRITGDGEMAELVREFDWAKTPVGPVKTWSDTLLTTVNLILASKHPMFLWWGPDLIQFYNDGYRPSIRADKHPRALGQRGIDCWPEIWPIIGPQIEAVMRNGESTWNANQLVPINRNGKLEEVFWTYSYSPVRDKNGTICGTLVVCSETTEQVLSERRLRTLLTIASESTVHNDFASSQPLHILAQNIVNKLENNPADVPFAALYLLNQHRVLHSASTAAAGILAGSEHWPLTQVVDSQAPLYFVDMQRRFPKLTLPPWPEPLSCAYAMPLALTGSSVQAVVVFGVSPRLPFDHRYTTFFALLATRIGGLLQDEVQKLAIAEAGARFSRLAEANPFGTVIGDLRGQLNYVNPAFLKTLGYSESEVDLGNVRWDHLTPAEYALADARAIKQLREQGRCDVYEKAYIAKDGRRVPILIGASVIDSDEGEPQIAAFVTDLTPLRAAEEALRAANEELENKIVERTSALEAEIQDRKRAEISLRELTGRLLSTQDEERRHMARELHDHAGQTLVALGFNFSALLEAAQGQNPLIADLVAQSRQLSDDLSKEIRTLSYLLHPPLLDEAGLTSALQLYVDGFSKRSGIVVNLELPDFENRLPKSLELVLFRVIQESLTNVHRHSGSHSATIYISRSANAIKAEIVDQGKGIPPEKFQQMTAAQIGVGVRGMEERVRQFGGTLKIDSNSTGTRVTVTIPLASD